MLSPEIVAKTMAMLAIYFEVKDVPKEQIEIYGGIFNHAGITDEQLTQAAWMICQRTKHKYGRLPTANEVLGCLQKSAKVMALQGWNEVIKVREWSLTHPRFNAVSGLPYMREPHWSENSISKRCIDTLGGWQKFCEEPITDFIRKEFLDYYECYKRDEEAKPALPETSQPELKEGWKE